MFGRLNSLATTLLKEPPFRIVTQLAVKFLPVSILTKANWDVVAKPQYLVGLIHAAHEARNQGVDAFCAIEFGVAGGLGLVELQNYAAQIELALGVRIDVVGFDTGVGLPTFCGDHRDHPDLWRAGDYPMDTQALQNQLTDRTELILGPISDTLTDFVKNRQRSPVGFISFDMDLYSSTTDAMKIFSFMNERLLNRVTLYFDDVYTAIYHHRAGEYLAIKEFNESQSRVFIDKWHNVKIDRPFPESFWNNKMYIAHHLDAIDKVQIDRPVEVWTL